MVTVGTNITISVYGLDKINEGVDPYNKMEIKRPTTSNITLCKTIWNRYYQTI